VTPVLISAFEVPQRADEPFIAAWDRAREGARATLYRALRDDVRLRFVDLEGADAAAADLGYPAHLGIYDVAREDGDPDSAGGTVRIEPREVAEDADDRLLSEWDQVRRVLARQQGYLGARLHRSAAPADFRWVSLERWSSPLMVFRAGQRPDVREAISRMPGRSHPALYERVRG